MPVNGFPFHSCLSLLSIPAVRLSYVWLHGCDIHRSNSDLLSCAKQQYLSIPVYTIFKNLTIILIAYGEVLWFGGSVTPMTLASFSLMVSVHELSIPVASVSQSIHLTAANYLQVLSSLVAAWDDIGRMLSSFSASAATLAAISDADAAASARTAAGYGWMMVNCLASAGYVLGMRKRIKVTNFKVRCRSYMCFDGIFDLL